MKMKNILLVVLLVVLNIVCIQVFALGGNSQKSTTVPLSKSLQESTMFDKEAMVPQNNVGQPIVNCPHQEEWCYWMCIRFRDNGAGDECIQWALVCHPYPGQML